MNPRVSLDALGFGKPVSPRNPSRLAQAASLFFLLYGERASRGKIGSGKLGEKRRSKDSVSPFRYRRCAPLGRYGRRGDTGWCAERLVLLSPARPESLRRCLPAGRRWCAWSRVVFETHQSGQEGGRRCDGRNRLAPARRHQQQYSCWTGRRIGQDNATGAKIRSVTVITSQGSVYVPRLPK